MKIVSAKNILVEASYLSLVYIIMSDVVCVPRHMRDLKLFNISTKFFSGKLGRIARFKAILNWHACSLADAGVRKVVNFTWRKNRFFGFHSYYYRGNLAVCPSC
jgi:hypothetical protein